MSAKLALCTRFTNLPAPLFASSFEANLCLPLDPKVFEAPVELVDRAICETDPNWQQFIPYIVVRDKEGYVFTYCRGKGSEEARLKGNLSIGLGGHVDGCPPEGTSLKDWFVQEARRELNEEVGLSFNVSLDIEFTHMIKDATNPVGQVHFGLLAVVTLDRSELKLMEKDIVEGSSWLSVPSLFNVTNFPRLENWSQAVTRYLANQENVLQYHPV